MVHLGIPQRRVLLVGELDVDIVLPVLGESGVSLETGLALPDPDLGLLVLGRALGAGETTVVLGALGLLGLLGLLLDERWSFVAFILLS